MSDHYGDKNWRDASPGFDSDSMMPQLPDKYPFTTSQYSHVTSQSSSADHDNDCKLSSIVDSITSVDSGIASMSITEEDKHRRVLEIIGETPEMCRDTNSKDQTSVDSISADANISSITSDYGSVPPSSEIDERFVPFIPDKTGYSLLHLAIVYKNMEQAIEFIQDSLAPELLDFFTPDVHTALHLAVYMNLPEIVRFLIVYGANILFRDRRGNTALHTACELGRTMCVRMLLSPLEGAEDLGAQNSKVPQDINEKNYEGLTPLHLATINYHASVVELLLQQRNIGLNIEDSTSGRTALHHALERRSIDCFNLLLKKSANVNATTYDGCSPLHLAVGLGLVKETRTLMTRGANAKQKTSDDTCPWDLAKTQNLKDALQYSSLQMTQMSIKQR